MSVSLALTRMAALRHKTFVRGFSGLAPYYVVNEFPKSGGSWLAEMISDALGVPFRRNAPIRLERSVTHGHFLNPIALRNVVILWRDPRDLLVSFYYHCYFVNEHHNSSLVRLMRRHCPFDDYKDTRSNLPKFIRFLTKTPISPKFTWPDFARVWANRAGTLQTSYEALRANTPSELSRVVEALTRTPLSKERAEEVAELHCFTLAKKQAEQIKPANAEVSFIREGALGGWRKHFTSEACSMLMECGYADGMSALGYSMINET